MSRAMEHFWTVTLVLGVGTWLLRASFLYAMDWIKLPPRLEQALSYIPAAVLSAIVVPAVLFGRPQSWDVDPERLAAGLAAALVAWRTRNVVLTIATGLGALWLMARYL